MPRYVYKCDTSDCGGEKTIICKLKDKPDIVQCPICGCIMDQDFSDRGIAFKGTGWTPKFGPIGRG